MWKLFPVIFRYRHCCISVIMRSSGSHNADPAYFIVLTPPQSRRHGGHFGGLAPQTELWNTINRWSFYQISECQAPLNKRKASLVKTFWRRFCFALEAFRVWDPCCRRTVDIAELQQIFLVSSLPKPGKGKSVLWLGLPLTVTGFRVILLWERRQTILSLQYFCNCSQRRCWDIEFFKVLCHFRNIFTILSETKMSYFFHNGMLRLLFDNLGTVSPRLSRSNWLQS